MTDCPSFIHVWERRAHIIIQLQYNCNTIWPTYVSENILPKKAEYDEEERLFHL